MITTTPPPTTAPPAVVTLSEAAHLTGCTLRQAGYWARLGYLGPRLQRTARPGARHQLDRIETTRLAVLAAVAPIASDQLRRVAKAIDGAPEAWPDQLELADPTGRARLTVDIAANVKTMARDWLSR